MSDNKNAILKEIVEVDDIKSENAINIIMHEFNAIDVKFLEYEDFFWDDLELFKDIYECHEDVKKIYSSIIGSTLDEFFYNVYGHSATLL